MGGTASSGTIGSYRLKVQLAAGANTIEFGNPYDWAPDIDRITVGP